MTKLTAALLASLPIVTFVSMAYSAGDLSAEGGWGAWAEAQMLPLLLLAGVSAVLFGALASVGSMQRAQERREALLRGETPRTAWAVFWRKLYSPLPLAAEKDALLDHDYDGIRELDNSLPPWWLYTFYGSIAFAVVYMGAFVSGAPALRSGEEYAAEMAAAEAEVAAYLATQADLVDETNAELLTDLAAVARGGETFATYCAACHAADGGGGVGPNLTDGYWIHGGGDVRGVFATVKYGVPEKGMIAWKSQLTASQIHEVASFVTTLAGTVPAEPKAPQGALVAALAE